MIRKTLHIVVAALVLISTMGITINLHYCHDQLIDFAFYSPAESCCEVDNKADCEPHEGLSKMNHCNDESIVVEALDNFLGSSFAINLDNDRSTELFYGIAWQFDSPLVDEVIKSIIPEFYYPPPYQEVDLSQIQSYLI